MITITKKEELILNQVRIFNDDFPEGIPLSHLRQETLQNVAKGA